MLSRDSDSGGWMALISCYGARTFFAPELPRVRHSPKFACTTDEAVRVCDDAIETFLSGASR
jgi:hypothetical protein